MLTHRTAISNLKMIETDLEKAIINGFLCLLLCVLHLQQNDKTKLREFKLKGGSQAINMILAGIYRRQWSNRIR